MKAIIAANTGAVLTEVPTPAPKAKEVLIQVKANSLNRADLMMLQGADHGGWGGGAGKILGLEWAGDVVEVGADVKEYHVGDRVMSVGPQAFAEYTIGNPIAMNLIPDGMSYEEAACLPVALQTMHDAISTLGGLTIGQTILFQGASSAMGLIGMQAAKYQGAGKVIGTSRSAERCAKLMEYGCDAAVDTSNPAWEEEVLKETDGAGVDLLIDFLSGPIMNKNLQVTRIGGRIVNVGRSAGETGEFNFDLHNMRRITYIGASFRTRTLAETAEVILRTKNAFGQALKEGSFKMPIDKTYPMEEAAEAFKRMIENKHFGKIVLNVYKRGADL